MTKRVIIVTDAWAPQINGVVRTLEATARELARLGHEVTFITPQSFKSLPCPTYPEIRLSLPLFGQFTRVMEAALGDQEDRYIHISTEGPLGLAARAYCLRHGLKFTTAYHTKFPEYVEARFHLPISWTYRFIRWFHRPSAAIMCATAGVAQDLAQHGILHSCRWSRGVDVEHYNPGRRLTAKLPPEFLALPKPVLLYVGRVAVEKNIEAFLDCEAPGSKVVVGAGPQLASLRARYPEVLFLGPRYGDELADLYAASDVFVFPSRTDTFGLVLLEALASGTPVAAYPVTGPLDVIGAGPAGCLDSDLGQAIVGALRRRREDCRAHALSQSWDACARQFLGNLVGA
ncbi:glycosyltransferase family 4 protein [Govanella unica]|uniref:Glycosyltransferase family 1 protein n=1 Tax=Govanella unica TaxID=2975056 RepID=A0A9X3TZX4_9PROT|nr:glycosyltransferase family 1 protein [Govania unica]MDA5194815.1 glycosyltransferase family 1 protein [Govania unica]